LNNAKRRDHSMTAVWETKKRYNDVMRYEAEQWLDPGLEDLPHGLEVIAMEDCIELTVKSPI
jgi:hypothetical protein